MKFKKGLIALTLTNLVLASIPVQAAGNQTAFYVSSSDSGNQVNYDVRLNSDCTLAPTEAVHSYMLNSDGSTRVLDSLEQEGYGITNQSPLNDNSVSFSLNAFQYYGIEKTVTVASSKDNTGDCNVQAMTTINENQAQLSHLYVDLNRTKVFGITVGVQIFSLTLVGLDQQIETIECHSNCVYGL